MQVVSIKMDLSASHAELERAQSNYILKKNRVCQSKGPFTPMSNHPEVWHHFSSPHQTPT